MALSGERKDALTMKIGSFLIPHVILDGGQCLLVGIRASADFFRELESGSLVSVVKFLDHRLQC